MLPLTYMRNEGKKFNKSPSIKLSKKSLIVSEEDKFVFKGYLGKGTFADVYLIEDLYSDHQFAIKIYKYGYLCTKTGFNEIDILERLKKYKKYFVQIHSHFLFQQHFCVVQELLMNNLYEIIESTEKTGLGHQLTKIIAKQVLSALKYLKLEGITHCDIKPENICISNNQIEHFEVKIIDFGSSFIKPKRNNFYVQSRFYRAPETILGINYDNCIDIWSFSCVIFEIFTGKPLFPGKSNLEQIIRYTKLLGMPPLKMLDVGKNTLKYFHKEISSYEKNKSLFTFQLAEYDQHRRVELINSIGPYKLYNNSEFDFQKAFDKKMFKKELMYKSDNSEENNILIEFILSMLKFHSSERPDIDTLEQHKYLSDINKDLQPEKEKQLSDENIAYLNQENYIYRKNSHNYSRLHSKVETQNGFSSYKCESSEDSA